MTDANLILGRLSPTRFFGGRLKLDLERARRAMETPARKLRRDPVSLAQAIVGVANSNMERAIRVISLERGFDVRDFTLVAFGGAGPLHACDLARELGLRRVVVPPSPGNFCALGAVLADVLKERSRTLLVPCDASSTRVLDSAARDLEKQLRHELANEGCSPTGARVLVFAEMRYRGQSYELMIPWSGSLARLRRDFDAAHLRRYGHQIPDKPADIVNMLVQIRIPVHRPAFARRRNIRRVAPERARAFIEGRWRTIDHYERSALPRKLRGPAIIHEAGATTYVPPASYLEVDAWGNLVLEFR